MKYNLTEFNGNMLRQIKGTASYGPCDYADVSVNKIDQLIYASYNGEVAESGVDHIYLSMFDTGPDGQVLCMGSDTQPVLIRRPG